MSRSHERLEPFYPQVGVAVTCRSFREYGAMFDVEEDLLRRGPILDVAAGASSFTAEASERGHACTAVDPRYALAPDALVAESAEEIAVSTAKLKKLQEVYDWTYYGSIEAHRANREASLERFADHYRRNEEHRSYVSGTLPHLPFAKDSFALVLCSHFLFLYEEQFSVDFHREALLELYRVVKPGGELRVYPIRSLRFAEYRSLGELIRELERIGASVDRLPSRLPFIPGSTQLLRVRKA